MNFYNVLKLNLIFWTASSLMMKPGLFNTSMTQKQIDKPLSGTPTKAEKGKNEQIISDVDVLEILRKRVIRTRKSISATWRLHYNVHCHNTPVLSQITDANVAPFLLQSKDCRPRRLSIFIHRRDLVSRKEVLENVFQDAYRS